MANGLQRIATSRYNSRLVADPATVAVVCTSIGAPRWPLPNPIAANVPDMMPKREWLGLDLHAYQRVYLDKVARYGADHFLEIFERLADQFPGKTIALCCYEDLRKPGEWCHRRIFADWLFGETGLAIPELQEEAPKTAKPTQGALW